MLASTLFPPRIVAIALCCLLWSGMTPAQAQSDRVGKAISALDAPLSDTDSHIRNHCGAGHLGECVDRMIENANDALVRLLERVPQLILALLVLLFASWISRFIANRLHLIRIRSQNPYMSGLLRTIVRTAIMLVAVLIALDLIGLTSVVGAVLGSAGVVGLVLGFAFREIAENYIAGILLSVRRPFEPGEHVVIENREGKVISVNSRATVLMTMDGNHLQLPNSLVFKSIVLNYSKNPKRRFDFTMLIDGSQSIRESQALAMAAIAQIEGVLEDPAPSWVVVEFGAVGIQLRFYGWVDQRETDPGKVRSEAIRRVKAAFAEACIEAPRTLYHIVSTRQRDVQVIDAMVEPENGADTSVNRDIDVQVAAARADDAGVNLLQPDAKQRSKPP
ncbi:MAG: mechanosensitive ion channel family protein [Lysobacteraceae bacterium]